MDARRASCRHRARSRRVTGSLSSRAMLCRPVSQPIGERHVESRACPCRPASRFPTTPSPIPCDPRSSAIRRRPLVPKPPTSVYATRQTTCVSSRITAQSSVSANLARPTSRSHFLLPIGIESERESMSPRCVVAPFRHPNIVELAFRLAGALRRHASATACRAGSPSIGSPLRSISSISAMHFALNSVAADHLAHRGHSPI